MVTGDLELVAATAEDTRAIGAAIGAVLEPADVVSLTGDLGAGKTSFVQGAAASLGVPGPVLSPTFTLVREYEGRLPVHHLDVYRLERLQDVLNLGFEEMLDQDAVVFIEWGDVIDALLPEDHLSVEISIPEHGEGRRIRVVVPGGRWEERRSRLSSALAPWSEPRDGMDGRGAAS